MLDLAAAERLAFSDVVAVPTRLDVLRITGPEATAYLHGQLSQDVEHLAVGSTARTLLLQPQGKVEAWMRLHRRAEDELWLDVDAGWGAAARDRLERFKLRTAVDIEVVTTGALAIRGPATGGLVDRLDGGAVALTADWAGLVGADLVPLPLTDGADGLSALAAVGADPSIVGPAETLELVRVRLGQPAMGRELDESTIPAAARIVDGSVDFTKGCYVGQELVARIDSRGSATPTRLEGIRLGRGPAAGLGVEPGAELIDGDARVGTLTSVVDSPDLGTIGLAYLKRSVEVPRSLAVVTASGGSVPAEAVPLPSGA